MNKFIAFGFSLLLSVSSIAMPTVGESALYEWTHALATKVSVGTATRSIIKYNPSTGFTTRLVTEMDGKTSSNDQESASLPTDAWILDLLANCAAYGGTLETLVVKAGSFETCSMPINSRGNTGRAWFAHVPFGFVKSVVNGSKGNSDTLELQSYFSPTM